DNMEANQIFSLKGKVALITGASKGIGEAIAHFFAANGAQVVINSRKQEDLDKVAAAIINNGGQCIGFAGNAGDINACKDLVEKIMAHFGGI
ncbi:SDR family NAD(P)-dependent oxidoreductase, partial [Acinetobacter baumannii]